MMKNCRPYSIENGSIDDALITDHSQDDINLVCNWIRNNIIPRKTPLYGYSSYKLKHIFEHDTKLYLTNNEFKDAMLMCGYSPVNANELNWEYCISKKSPALLRK